jgi:hypothetical protein
VIRIDDQSPTEPQALRKWLEALPDWTALVDAGAPNWRRVCQIIWRYDGCNVDVAGSDFHYRVDHSAEMADLARWAPYTVVWLPSAAELAARLGGAE